MKALVLITSFLLTIAAFGFTDEQICTEVTKKIKSMQPELPIAISRHKLLFAVKNDCEKKVIVYAIRIDAESVLVKAKIIELHEETIYRACHTSTRMLIEQGYLLMMAYYSKEGTRDVTVIVNQEVCDSLNEE
jgi:hypothetical protein